MLLRSKSRERASDDWRSMFALPAIPASFHLPLFLVALLFLSGILLAQTIYLKPASLLFALFPIAAVYWFSIQRAPRLASLILVVFWITLGYWSAETELQPAASTVVTGLVDGLLRSVEGTVTSAEPMRYAAAGEQDQGTADHDIENAELSGSDTRDNQSQQTQRVDLLVTDAELISDQFDTIVPIARRSSGLIRVTIRWSGPPAAEVHCGDRLGLLMRLSEPDVYHDPAVWNRYTYLASQSISATGTIAAGDTKRLRVLNRSGERSMPCLLNQWRQAATAKLESLPALTHNFSPVFQITGDDAGMLSAMLTGDRSYLTQDLRTGFERTGSFHLIVVSGLHLAVLAGFIFAMARRIRLGNWSATFVTILCSLAFALFTGFSIPIQRSFWMITLYLVGRLIFRERSPLNVIGFAALCLMAASPRSILDASLQMTLLSVTAIAGVAVPLLQLYVSPRIRATHNLKIIALDVSLPPRIAQFRVLMRIFSQRLKPITGKWVSQVIFPFTVRLFLRLVELLFIGVVVEIALSWSMAMYFHRITLYALPVNLVVLPLLGLLLPAAMITLLTLSLWPPLAIASASLCGLLLHLDLRFIHHFGGLHFGDVRIPEPTAIQITLATIVFILAVFLAHSRRPRFRYASMPALFLMVVVSLWPRSMNHPSSALLFQAIDVGQGDSLLLISPEGKTLLEDGGGLVHYYSAPSRSRHSSSATRQDSFDIGEQVVSPVLWSRAIRHLDVVVLTHAHQDHLGGIRAILRNFHPHELWVGNNPLTPAYKALLNEAIADGVSIRVVHTGQQLSLGSVRFRVLAPQASYLPGATAANDDSVVLQASLGSTSILLEGDAEAPEENGMLADAALRSTILKVAHHGSISSTRPEFLARVAPQWAVISCGLHNHFGHPRFEILDELQKSRVRTYRTDIDGTVCFLLDGKDVTAEPMCRSDAASGLLP